MNDCKYCGGQCPEHVDKNGNPNHHTCFDYLSSMVHNTSTCSIVAVNSTMLRNETKTQSRAMYTQHQYFISPVLRQLG